MNRLNICFDGRILYNGYVNNSGRTGIYFTAKNIIQCLSKRNINLYLYFEKYDDRIYDIIDELKINIDKNNVLFNNSDFSSINSFLSPIYVIPNCIDKFSNVSKYMILYDIIPLCLYNYFREGNEQTWFSNCIKQLSKDEYYFAISEYTRLDFLKYFGNKLNKDNIDVIPLSTNLDYKPNKDIEALNIVKKKYNIPLSKKYLFSLCSLEPRKNLIRAVRTFIEFINKNKINDLVYVLGGGALKGFMEKLEKEFPNYKNYQDKIIRAGYIDDEDLEVLYSNAEWFVYTSQYEGFGMPPLEAMKCGCPVITSNNSSLPEVVGDSAITIDYDSDLQHIEAYEKYYYNEDLRKEMSQKGLERAKLFSWDNTVDIIINKMKEVEAKKANKPLVTIITATYNLIENGRKEYFLQNLESVQSQTYKNIEHIIIDGASTDGTLELLKEYEQKGLIKYYSEPDKGIYDAINKGILKANGKYVVCLNSDDFYCNNKAVELEVMKLEENDADACYANARVYNEKGKLQSIWRGKEHINLFFCGNMPNHQTFMIKIDALKELGLYNLKYKVSADSNFIYKLYFNNKKFVCIDLEIVVYRLGGYSKLMQNESWRNQEDSFNEFWGENYQLTRMDIHNLARANFLKLPLQQAINLGSRLKNQYWIEEYFKILFNHHLFNHNGLSNSTQKRTYRLFNFIPLLKIKRKNNKTKVYLFSILPLLKIKRHNEKDCRVYLLWFIPFLRIKNKPNKVKFYLFSIIPIFKIG